MLLVEFFNAEDCKGTELVEGWYWHDEDNGGRIGGPYETEEAAIVAAQFGTGWFWNWLVSY